MKVSLRMTRRLSESALDRLRRPHAFAAERVAFAYGRRGVTKDGEVIVISEIVDVEDGDYEDDPSVGARINSMAIHKALQRALDLKAGAFHVHIHEHRGMPWFSRLDLRELPGVVKPFGVLVPDQPFGLLLFSDDDCIGLVWHRRDKKPTALRDVAIVGTPSALLRGGRS
jgi:hypothetical protein